MNNSDIVTPPVILQLKRKHFIQSGEDGFHYPDSCPAALAAKEMFNTSIVNMGLNNLRINVSGQPTIRYTVYPAYTIHDFEHDVYRKRALLRSEDKEEVIREISLYLKQ